MLYGGSSGAISSHRRNRCCAHASRDADGCRNASLPPPPPLPLLSHTLPYYSLVRRERLSSSSAAPWTPLLRTWEGSFRARGASRGRGGRQWREAREGRQG